MTVNLQILGNSRSASRSLSVAKPWLGAALLCGLVANPVFAAEQISIEHDDRQLVGHMQMADGADLSDGVVVIVHGTLAHGQMEITRSMQQLLAEAGLNALTINLSYGLDARTGMYDCDVTHRHRHEDGAEEVAAWVDWLEGQSVGPVNVVGHSRGGNNVAWYLADFQHDSVEKAVVLAPATWEEGREIAQYHATYDADLNAILAQAQAYVDEGKPEQVMELDFLYCPETTATAESVLSIYQENPRMNTPDLLTETQTPTLVIIAGDDQTVTDLDEQMQPVLHYEHIHVDEVIGADHMFMDLFLYDAVDMTVDFFAGND